jgi:uncharacterized coiled-coil protein SlyX
MPRVVARDWRDERIAELENLLRERDRQIAELTQQVSRLLARVAQLEDQVRQSSSNSSKPPSSDSPRHAAEKKKRRTQRGRGRQPGGQPGRTKCARALVPADQVAKSHTVKPNCCERCQRKLRGNDPNPTVHQVWHLPAVQPWVEQWLLRRSGLMGALGYDSPPPRITSVSPPTVRPNVPSAGGRSRPEGGM